MTQVTVTDVRSFSDLGVDDAVVEALADAGIDNPFPIQELSLPMALAGADLIGQARTGTGKTLAFGIPLVQRVDPSAGYTQALVVVPTRELCLQVHDDLVVAGSTRTVQVVAAYGGRAIDPQSEAIAAGAPIVVGTPGRLLDLVRRGLLNLSRVTMLVLDEADEMLDMGFLPDVEQLIERCAQQRQTLLFSATVPSEVVRLARRYMNKPTFMRSDVQQQSVAPEMRQMFFACHRLDKPAVVARILASPSRGRTLIFTRTKRMADVLAGELRARDIDAGVIHSDLRQEARERALARFRKGTQDVLCATEVAARGLDIDQVTHVINYDCPDDERMYLHRIGRTGRAGAAGVAITLAVWNELARLEMIKRALQIEDETHEVFSTSPLLDELFGQVPTDRAAPTDGADRNGTAPSAAPTRDGAADGAPGSVPPRGGRRSRRTRRRRQPGTTPAAPGDGDVPWGDAIDTASAGTHDTSASAAPGDEVATPGSGALTAPGSDTTPPGAHAEDASQPAPAPGDDGAAPDDVTAPGTGALTAPGSDTSPPAADTEDASQPAPAAGARTDAPATDADAAATRGRGDRARPASTRARGGRSRSGGARRKPSTADRPNAREPVVEPVSPASRSARGEGKPTLNRPLEITYLP